MSAVSSLSQDVGKKSACEAPAVPRATFYRHMSPKPKPLVEEKPSPVPVLALDNQEKRAVIDLLHSERFQDKAPRQVYAALLDEGLYHCSVRSMYRLLTQEHGDVKERRRHVQRPHYTKPELLATAPNQVWSWDITKLKGAMKWTYFYLYVILDIFSRYVVGWMVAQREQDGLARRLIEETCLKQGIKAGQLTVHADRGPSMRSKTVAHLLSDMGVTKTHSRPHVSNDNPYSEAQFKTLKYCPQFPERFGSIQDARSFCQEFFTWYNKEHYHSGIGLMTPESVHYCMAEGVFRQHSIVLAEAYEKHPKRFKGRIPKPPALPEAAWINKPIFD